MHLNAVSCECGARWATLLQSQTGFVSPGFCFCGVIASGPTVRPCSSRLLLSWPRLEVAQGKSLCSNTTAPRCAFILFQVSDGPCQAEFLESHLRCLFNCLQISEPTFLTLLSDFLWVFFLSYIWKNVFLLPSRSRDQAKASHQLFMWSFPLTSVETNTFFATFNFNGTEEKLFVGEKCSEELLKQDMLCSFILTWRNVDIFTGRNVARASNLCSASASLKVGCMF